MENFNEWLNQRNRKVFNEIAQQMKFFTYSTDNNTNTAKIAFNEHGQTLLHKLFRRNPKYRFNNELEEPEDILELDQNLINMYKEELFEIVKNTPNNYDVDLSAVKDKVEDLFGKHEEESIRTKSEKAFDRIFEIISRMTRRAISSRNDARLLSIDATRQIYGSFP